MCEGLTGSCTFTASVESDVTNLSPPLTLLSAFKGPSSEGDRSLSDIPSTRAFPDYCYVVKQTTPLPFLGLKFHHGNQSHRI